MTILLIALAVLMLIVGMLGSVVPGLPGPPFSWLAILFAHLSHAATFSTSFIVGFAVAAVVITVLDYVVPSLSTKRHGGGKAGVWGCNIGLVVSMIGVPFGPTGLLGVVVWPFVGALVGELLSGKTSKLALRAAWGSFVGFLAGTGLKLAYAVVAVVFVVKGLL